MMPRCGSGRWRSFKLAFPSASTSNLLATRSPRRPCTAAPGSCCYASYNALQLLSPCRPKPHPLLTATLQKVDVWGAGIVLYALLYGQLPFEPSRPDIFAEHDERRRPPPEGRQVGSLFVGLVVWLLVG